jgi:uncharacterized protein (UPF0303 family)
MEVSEILVRVAHQEHSRIFARFDEEIGWALGSYIREWARNAGWPIVIDVRQFHPQLFFAALPGSTPDNIDWARRKIKVVERFHRSSYGIGQEMTAKGTTLERRYGLPLDEFAEHGGSFPITLDGCGTVGCVTVSGLLQRDDHMLVVRALCEIQRRPYADFDLTDC